MHPNVQVTPATQPARSTLTGHSKPLAVLNARGYADPDGAARITVSDTIRARGAHPAATSAFPALRCPERGRLASSIAVGAEQLGSVSRDAITPTHRAPFLCPDAYRNGGTVSHFGDGDRDISLYIPVACLP